MTTEIRDNFNSKNAPDYDLITGAILKYVAEVIMIAMRGKPPNEIPLYRPILLLSMISKVFNKFLVKILIPIIKRQSLGFRNKHSIIDQIRRIRKSLEENKFCFTVFLDVA